MFWLSFLLKSTTTTRNVLHNKMIASSQIVHPSYSVLDAIPDGVERPAICRVTFRKRISLMFLYARIVRSDSVHLYYSGRNISYESAVPGPPVITLMVFILCVFLLLVCLYNFKTRVSPSFFFFLIESENTAECLYCSLHRRASAIEAAGEYCIVVFKKVVSGV